MAEIYLANSDDGMSKLGSPILPDRGPFNALRESLPSLEPTRKNQREPNTGVTPMEINSRATSLALRSGMSTPVPLPVDRLTVPPTDQPLTKDREITTDPENTHPSNLAPIVDNKHLEMYINMFYSQKFMYEEARKNEDQVVMIAALNQAISSQELMLRIVSGEEMMSVCENWLAQAEMDIMFPKEQAAKDRISTATQASTPTPIHQTRSPSPQEDVAMVHRDPTPVQATAHSASSISSAHQITQNHAQRAVQNAMNASNYVNQTAQQAPHQNLVPNYAPAPTFAQNQNSATKLRQCRTSCQTTRCRRKTTTKLRTSTPDPLNTSRAYPVLHTKRALPPSTVPFIALEGTGSITTATNQQHPSLILLRNSAPPLTLFNTSQVETQGDPGGEGGIPNLKTTLPES
ncbi:hypothetical protein PSHT_15820 [Puccinia striiformis]|uniref:Uncharacterized protein n=1 Tax=Puccinia striiformis TaxID=27350 RepID=A0A2S4UD53_9BASI|nr:hypothetical protein PSHT_15820 [Puccinia striiformis]